MKQYAILRINQIAEEIVDKTQSEIKNIILTALTKGDYKWRNPDFSKAETAQMCFDMMKFWGVDGNYKDVVIEAIDNLENITIESPTKQFIKIQAILVPDMHYQNINPIPFDPAISLSTQPELEPTKRTYTKLLRHIGQFIEIKPLQEIIVTYTKPLNVF